MADPADDAAARNRWMAIQAMRIAGVVLVIFGMLIIRQVIAVPAWLGYVLLAAGLADVFLVPTMLARRWRSPRE